MKKNMGNLDKTIRLAVALVLVLLFYTDKIEGTLGIVALAAAAIFALTSIVNFCPLYSIFGINTCKIK